MKCTPQNWTLGAVFEVRVCVVRGSSVESTVRTVVIVLLDPARDARGLVEVLVLVEPHLLFFQAAMEPLDIAVALGMVVGGVPVR